MPHNVFISWSGERSGKMAEHLSMWLPRVIQRVKPWVSKADLYKGQRWFSELADALETGDVGILCVTRKNKEAPWLLFEAGSLAKKGKTRVFPYLLGTEYSELPDPLRQFNAVKAEKEETYRMLESINDIVAGDHLPQEVCRASFDKWWPDLDALLKNIPASPSPPPTPPSNAEILADLAAKVRAMPDIVAQAVADSVERLNHRQECPGCPVPMKEWLGRPLPLLLKAGTVRILRPPAARPYHRLRDCRRVRSGEMRHREMVRMVRSSDQ